MPGPAAIIVRADALAPHLPFADDSVDLVLFSPPFFQARFYTDGDRVYEGQIGLEATPHEYLDRLIQVTAEARRVMKPVASMFVELGDKACGFSGEKWGNGRSLGTTRGDTRVPATGPLSAPTVYGIPNKSWMLLPERYRVACVDRLGMIARAVIIWWRRDAMPESVHDRVARTHSDWVHLTKRDRYFSNIDEIRVPYAAGTAQRYEAGYQPRDFDGQRIGNGIQLGDSRYTQNPLGKLPGSVWDVTTESLHIPDYIVHDHAEWRFLDRLPLWRDVARRVADGDLRPVDVHEVDHWGVMTPEWPRRLILGFTPNGICLECGAGRKLGRASRCEECGEVRPFQVKACPACGDVRDWKADRVAMPGDDWHGVGARTPRHAGSYLNASISTGYSCACWNDQSGKPAPPTRPAIVLDPFSGSGTTAMAAVALGRHAVGVDYSLGYCYLSRWRIWESGHAARIRERTNTRRQLELILD